MIFAWTLAIALVTAIACALCGVFLVAKREAFISEGLSHAVLPGIILAYLVFEDRSSPWLILSAGLSGLMMVWLVQLIGQTRMVKSDASLGIVFSGLFSMGVLMASLNLEKVHFHADCIINGDLAYAPLSRFEVAGWVLGPKAFVVMSCVLLSLIVFISAFYKEMKLMTFDQPLARLLGFRPNLIHFGWLSLVSITAVAAFETAGTVLVVALMIAPAATANLLTNRLPKMIWISVVIAVVATCAGVWLSDQLNIPPSSSIASMAGISFVVAFFLSPQSGLVAILIRQNRSRRDMLDDLVHAMTLKEGGQIDRSTLIQQIERPANQIDLAIQRNQILGRLTLERGIVKIT